MNEQELHASLSKNVFMLGKLLGNLDSLSLGLKHENASVKAQCMLDDIRSELINFVRLEYYQNKE